MDPIHRMASVFFVPLRIFIICLHIVCDSRVACQHCTTCVRPYTHLPHVSNEGVRTHACFLYSPRPPACRYSANIAKCAAGMQTLPTEWGGRGASSQQQFYEARAVFNAQRSQLFSSWPVGAAHTLLQRPHSRMRRLFAGRFYGKVNMLMKCSPSTQTRPITGVDRMPRTDTVFMGINNSWCDTATINTHAHR
jgi:hypothetical protein